MGLETILTVAGELLGVLRRRRQVGQHLVRVRVRVRVRMRVRVRVNVRVRARVS